METLIAHLDLGFSTALSWQNLLYCFMGCFLGTMIGVLPGIGPIATIAMLLPLTYTLPPITALIMLSGIYYGAQYGGSTSAILVNLPGESSSVVTVLDGYQMARRGRAGPALSIAALGSFIAGCFGTLLLAGFASPLADLALMLGPAEYFSLMVLGLVGAAVMSAGSIIKALGMVLMGMLVGLVGTDVNSGVVRFAFGIPELADGIGFACVAMGMFGLAEIILNVDRNETREVFNQGVKELFPRWADLKSAWPAILRGTGLGSLLGILPGGGALLASFASYALEKKITRNPQPAFGQGNIRGVAGPEAANNAGAQSSFIPMLTLGIPSNGVMALMAGAMMIHNIQPGPQVMVSNPGLFWGLIASMWVGNLMLVILNLPLIGIWTRLLNVPYRILFPAILMFCSIGIYSLNSNPFDGLLMVFFALAGLVLIAFGCDVTSFLLGFILGPMMEENFRRAMLLSYGDPAVFLTRPLSLSLLLAALLLIISLCAPALARRRREAFAES